MRNEIGDNPTDRPPELSNCDFVKAVLMIWGVFYHSIVFWTGNWFVEEPVYPSNVLVYLAAWSHSFRVYGFALVSGYLFYYLKYEKGKYNKFAPFVANKVKRLLIPYVFTAVVWVIPISAAFFKWDISTIVNKYVLATAPSQLWFLVMLFDVFIIFWMLSNFFAKHNWIGLLIVIGFYGLSLVGGNFIPNIFSIWTACSYMVFFWLGFKIRQYADRVIRKIPAAIYILADILLFLAVQYLSNFDGMIFKLLNWGLNFALNVVGAIMAFAVLQKIADHVNWKENRVFSFLSKRSMAVYLFHQQVIYFFIYWLNGVVNPCLNAAVNFIGAMVVSLLISTVLLRFRWTRFLIGEKNSDLKRTEEYQKYADAKCGSAK